MRALLELIIVLVDEYCRRGAPCGYPNGTGKTNDWAPTRDAPTEGENEDTTQVAHSSTLPSEAIFRYPSRKLLLYLHES